MSAKEARQAEQARYILTRNDVAKRLGISMSTVRRMEHLELHPVQGPGSVWLFDPTELDQLEPRQPRLTRVARPSDPAALAARRRGRLAARVFQMFARSWALPQIVVATKQPPEVIRDLYHQWVTTLEEDQCRSSTE